MQKGRNTHPPTDTKTQIYGHITQQSTQTYTRKYRPFYIDNKVIAEEDEMATSLLLLPQLPHHFVLTDILPLCI